MARIIMSRNTPGVFHTITVMDLSLSDFPDSLHVVDNKIKSLEDSARTLKLHRNTLVPIARLPTEILTIIFSLLPSFGVIESSQSIAPFTISHVCHRWREILLKTPHLWSHIDFTNLTPTGTAEMLARAKMAPLHLEAMTMNLSVAKFEAIKGQIRAHLHLTRHLNIAASSFRLIETLGMIDSSAPSLEQLSITNMYPSWEWENSQPIIPVSLFDGMAPKLISLRLDNCGISWEWLLLKGLRDLKLFSFPRHAQTTLNIWLGALNQMTRLERLTLHGSIPIHTMTPLIVEPGPTIVISSLTELDISAPLRKCMTILAHLVLPALTRLCVNVRTRTTLTEHMQPLIPYVSRNAHGPQDNEALQSLFVGSKKPQAGIAAWIMPRQDTDVGLRSAVDLPDGICLPRVAFSITWKWNCESNIPVHDALLTALPLDSITSLTAKGRAPLNGQVWRKHAPRWHKLQRVRLFSSAVPAFREMLEDVPSGSSLLPSLEEVGLIDVFLNAPKVYYLYNMLTKLVELQIPLRVLDLRTCIATSNAVQLFSKIVMDVQGPVKRESADLDGKRRRGMEVHGEEGERDEEHGFGDVPTTLGSWDTDDDYDEDYDEEDTSPTSSEFDLLPAGE